MFKIDVIDALRERTRYLLALNGPEFFYELHYWWSSLFTEPRLRVVLETITDEARVLIETYGKHDQETVRELATIKSQFVARAPELDDSNAAPFLGIVHGVIFERTFAYFDKLCAAATADDGAPRLSADSGEDKSAAYEAIRILDGKLQEARFTALDAATGERLPAKTDQRPDLVDLFIALVNVRERHEHFHKTFSAQRLASPGVALAKLQKFLNDLIPAPRSVNTMRDWLGVLWGHVPTAFQAPPQSAAKLSDLDDALFGDRRLMSDATRAALSDWRRYLQSLIRRLVVDLNLRIGERSSLVRLLSRYKERCEWHDRDRLRSIAASTRARENALTAEFARWLFDQGLSPITRPLVGDLQPDLLDPSRLYVEAKRYNGSGKRAIVQGYWELHDGVMRLQGTKYAVSEVFYVVFREGGRRYVLPPEIKGESFTTFPCLIDIASTAESGSRQRYAPEEIPESAFLGRRGRS